MADELEDLARMTWGVYLITHANVDENDHRQCGLRRFMQKRYTAGERDHDDLMCSGLAYLRRLDILGDCELR
jgi:hypothetical protein